MKCCIQNCGNNGKLKKTSQSSTSNSERITFHLFPKDPKQRVSWLASLGIPNWVPTNRTVICSDHFKEDDFYFTKQGTRRIKHGVIPSIEDDSYGPAALKICKLCLSLNRKMYRLQDYGLDKMYQDIIGIVPRTDANNRLPMGICWECTTRLQSAASFRSKALFSDTVLQDHLKNNAELKISDILSIHRQHTNLKSTWTVQEVFKFNSHDIEKHTPNTLIKTELISIPHHEEIEIDVQNLVTNKINIKHERKNDIIEDIYSNADVKTEIDMIPITEIEIGEKETDFEDDEDGDSGDGLVKENIYVNEANIGSDNYVLRKSGEKLETMNLYKNVDNSDDDDEQMDLSKSIDSEDDDQIAANDDVTNVCDDDVQTYVSDEMVTNVASEAIVCIEDKTTEVKKTKAAVKRKARKEDDVSIAVKERPKKNKQPYVKPSVSIDENIFDIKPLNHDELRREILVRREGVRYTLAPFKCEVCFKGFPTQDKQERHMIKHSEMDCEENESGKVTPSYQQIVRYGTALVDERSPSGTLRVPTSDQVILEQTSMGNLQSLRLNERFDITDHEDFSNPGSSTERQIGMDILPLSFTSTLEVDSGSDIDDDEDYYTEETIRQILEASNEDVAVEEEIPPAHLEHVAWSDNFEHFTGVEEIYREQSGPNIASKDPLEIFRAIWDRGIMENIVAETNQYAWQTIMRQSEHFNDIPVHSRICDWVDVTVEEMYKFFSILIYMGLCYRGRLAEYWSTDVLGMPEFRKIMSRNRFFMILNVLHFVNDYDSNGTLRVNRCKTAKIDPIVAHCNQKFQEIYTPRRHLSLDDSLLVWKGSLSWMQCVRSKAARFGVKSYELCEAETGFVLKLIIHSGKNTSAFEAVHGFTGPTSKIVLTLMDGYLNKGHCLVMDNFYNSVALTRFLKNHHTDVLGSLNRRRLDTPSDIRNLNDKRLPKGTVVARHSGNISVLSWKDVKLVNIISTYHNADTAEGFRAGQRCLKPVAVHAYNKYMAGVDMKEQKQSMYSLERKRALKWYIKVFRKMLNNSILNSFIIHCENSKGERKLTHRQFRYALGEKLSQQHLQIQRIRSTRAANPGEARFDHIDHFPDRLESADRTTKAKVRYRRGRCVQCIKLKKRTESNVICKKCLVFLCTGPCWAQYHTCID